jgi:hypothetical protein
MADVDGDLINTDTSGDPNPTKTFDTLSEPADGVEVFNSVTGGGGGATIVRQNPELTRTNP